MMKINMKLMLGFLMFIVIASYFAIDVYGGIFSVDKGIDYSFNNIGLMKESKKPELAPGPVINFAAVADQHYGGNIPQIPLYEDETIYDWNYHEDLPEMDFVVATFGDWAGNDWWANQWTSEKTWEEIVKNNTDYQKIPYFSVLGNHDLINYGELNSTKGNPVLKERIGRAISGMNENNYAFMYNNVLFISAAQTNVLYHLSNFQRDWIEYLVNKYPDHTTVIWSHQAIYETTGNGDGRASSWTERDYRVHNNFDWWRNLFESNPQIKLYIHGHTERGFNTTVLDAHAESWDDECTFVLVPATGKNYGQETWSYIFTLDDKKMEIRLWDSEKHEYQNNSDLEVPYMREGKFKVKNTGMEWFSVPKRVLDGQEWTWYNKMLAKDYAIELIGTNVTEQIDNPDLSGCHESDEGGGNGQRGFWYAVRGDGNALNLDTGEEDGFIKIKGGNILELAASSAFSEGNGAVYTEGNVPYNTAIAVPNKTYEFKATIKTESGVGSVDFLATIPKYLDLNINIVEDYKILENATITDQYQTVSATFILPDNDLMWFIQPKIKFNDPNVTYIWEDWSLQMVAEGDSTEDFTITLNGDSKTVSGILEHHKYELVDIPNIKMSNKLKFKTEIKGNKVGMVRLIYRDPQLWSDDVTFGVMDNYQTQVYLGDISPFNGHTSIMSFNDVEYGIKGNGFYGEKIRDKMSYFNNLSDSSINGVYEVFELKTNTFSP